MPKAKYHIGETTEKIRAALATNPQATASELNAQLGITKSSAYYHLMKIRKEPKKNGKRSQSGEVHQANGHGGSDLEIQQAYLTGKIEQLVRGYAESQNIPFGTLAEGVGTALRTFARREVLRAKDHLSSLPNAPAA